MIRNEYEYLIVGGGIAGLLLAFQLEQAGISFLVIDEGLESSSSKVAAGMFNPISGKRMTVNWKANELLANLHETFAEMEQKLGENYLVQAKIIQAFGNVKESNDFSLQLEKTGFSQFVNTEIQAPAALQAEFGAFEVTGAGWVKTQEWIKDFQGYLLQTEQLIFRKKSWDELKKNGDKWQWRDLTFTKVVSCDGFQFQYNPYFNWLPFKLCKGQVLHISCAGLNPNIILKKGVYLVHQQEDIYKVGATYEWEFNNDLPNDTGKEHLQEKLAKLLNLPYTIVGHQAGIRPTTRDRAAILGEHPKHKNLFFFNGLGTKGILQAPYLAKHLLAHIEQQLPLEEKIDISRFASFYSSGQL